jgi:hypothetical protein
MNLKGQNMPVWLKKTVLQTAYLYSFADAGGIWRSNDVHNS